MKKKNQEGFKQSMLTLKDFIKISTMIALRCLVVLSLLLVAHVVAFSSPYRTQKRRYQLAAINSERKDFLGHTEDIIESLHEPTLSDIQKGMNRIEDAIVQSQRIQSLQWAITNVKLVAPWPYYTYDAVTRRKSNEGVYVYSFTGSGNLEMADRVINYILMSFMRGNGYCLTGNN